MGNSAGRDIAVLDRAELSRRACALRRKRYSYEAIAKELKIKGGRGQAHKLVQGAIEGIPREDASEVLALELEGIDVLESKAWERHAKGDPAAADQILRIKARRAKYLALDKNQPEHVLNVTAIANASNDSDGDVSPEMAARLVREFFGAHAATSPNASRPTSPAEPRDAAEGAHVRGAGEIPPGTPSP